MVELMSEERLTECGMCGGEMSRNPHPDAGLLHKLSEVGALWECIPCAVSGRSKAYWRAVAAEGEIDRLRAERAEVADLLERAANAMAWPSVGILWGIVGDLRVAAARMRGEGVVNDSQA